jgi:hypothetical protein
LLSGQPGAIPQKENISCLMKKLARKTQREETTVQKTVKFAATEPGGIFPPGTLRSA